MVILNASIFILVACIHLLLYKFGYGMETSHNMGIYKKYFETGPALEPQRLRLTQFLDGDGSINMGSLSSHKRDHRRYERQQERESIPVARILSGAELPKKLKRKRDYAGYDPERSRSSNWYKEYVLPNNSDRCLNLKSKQAKRFRRRFRMPIVCFRELMTEGIYL